MSPADMTAQDTFLGSAALGAAVFATRWWYHTRRLSTTSERAARREIP